MNRRTARPALLLALVVPLLGLAPATQAFAATALTAPAPPTATFTDPGSGTLGAPVSFDVTSATPGSGGTITWYLWDFGDGQTTSTATAQPVNHTYSSVGTFHVTLTVVDSYGDIGQVEHDIRIGGAPPTASFIPDSGTVLTGSVIQFDGTPSSDPDASITGYSWSFGDGSTASGPHPTHTYTKPGTYSVSLTVTDAAGKTSTVTDQLSVIAPPPVQTLIETITAAPAALRSGRPSVSRFGLVDLGERLFCPGVGPSCQTTVRAIRARRLTYTAWLSIPANSSFELVLLLSRTGLKSLRAHGNLGLRVTIASARGAEQTIDSINLVLRPPATKA